MGFTILLSLSQYQDKDRFNNNILLQYLERHIGEDGRLESNTEFELWLLSVLKTTHVHTGSLLCDA